MRPFRLSLMLLFAAVVCSSAQEKSVKPGINDSFKNPDVQKYQKTFEGESREVFVNREKIVAECQLKPGMVVADVGAGTGLHTRLFAKAVGADGQVFAVDIAAKFLEHIQKTSRDAGLKNVTPVLCNFDSVDLPKHSVDLVFICDAYHHFEFPYRTMASIHRAIKPGGRLVVVDFQRIEGKSSDWTLNHVRAGQEVVEREITEAGFRKSSEVKDLLKDNYMVIFTKVEEAPAKTKETGAPRSSAVTPIVPGHGAVVPLPNAVEPPTSGSKVVLDVTAVGKEASKPLPGMERAATLLNLTGVTQPKPTDIAVTLVLHGEATYAALDDDAYQAAIGHANPNAKLLTSLRKAGVKVLVCGQSLARKGLDLKRVRPEVTVAASAISAVINLQSQGYAYIPAQ